MIGKKNPCNHRAYSGIGGKIGGEMRVLTGSWGKWLGHERDSLPSLGR